MKWNRFLLIFLTIGLLASCGNKKKDLVRSILSSHPGKYVVYVSKKTFTLQLFNSKAQEIGIYRIGYGLNPDKKKKMYAGDERTPEGLYTVSEILSIDADKQTTTYKKLKAMNGIYFKAKDGHYKYGHIKKDLGNNAYGPRFFRISYPNQKDIEQYNNLKIQGKLPMKKGKIPGIGSGLAIHGNADASSIGHLASGGCIRMYNTDIIELNQFIQLGTPVFITKKE